jgi:hypothetical protein
MDQMNEVVMSQLQNSEAIRDFYNENVSNIDEYRVAQLYIANDLFSQFVSLFHKYFNFYLQIVYFKKSSYQKYVVGPLNSILELSTGPSKLIQKRNDKMLDYESLLSKTEKNKDLKVRVAFN